MNARLAARLARPPQRNATAKAITHVQWLWHLAGCRHALAGTTPADQLDADHEALNRLIAVSRLGGC